MIPVASVHRAEVSGDFELAFTCAHCAASSRAQVRATGTGEATGLPLARKPPDLAEKRARANLEGDARELASLARCPKCKRRSARGIRTWWIVYGVQAAFVLAVFAALPALLFAFMFPSAGLSPAHFALLALVVPYLAIRFVLRLRQVDRRVVFVS